MTITEATTRRLLMDSAGVCGNPVCRAVLYAEFRDGAGGTLYERAHVIARSRQGPRGDEAVLTGDELDAYDNLILLCPSCHRLADKFPDQYPVSLLRAWKRDHLSQVRSAFAAGVPSRDELRERIRPLMLENRAVHEDLGPESEPEGRVRDDAVKMWRDQVVTVILPNNQKIYSLLSENRHLLTPKEQAIVGRFFVHMNAFEYNQLSGDKNAAAPRFPIELSTILGGV